MTRHEINWWYWRISAVLLTYGFLWNPLGYCFAGVLNIVHLVHFIVRERSLTSFTVQVRWLYLAILAAASPEPLRPLYVVPLIGTWALVLYGYCFLARILTLAPWNRSWTLSSDRFWDVLTAAPDQGSAFDVVLGGAGCHAMNCDSRHDFAEAP